MSYLVLARKYRPRTFADMVGQEVAANTLKGAIAEGRVAHAYLFHGPRGTGKTTSARIFAKALNCEKGPTTDPCGECERCRAADANAEADLIELDAASNRRIDDVRELLAQVAYAPMRARFKVYILDEAHMLTKEASNALLKTLEEPPAHVKFFLATTEPDKILATIRSRCQIVQLSPLSEQQIAERLEWVFAREGIQAEPGVAAELARRARGGLRDALSNTDQLLSLAGSKPTLADVERLSGAGGAEEFEALCDALERHDAAAALALLPETRGSEVDLCGGLLEHVRAMLVIGLCGRDAPFVEATSALRAKLAERAQRLGSERLQLWMEELLAARERMRLVPTHARVVLESALLALARAETSWSLAELTERLLALEERLARGGASTPRAAPTETVARPSFSPSADPAPRPTSPAAAESAPRASFSAPNDPPSRPSFAASAPVAESTPRASFGAPTAAPASSERAFPAAPAAQFARRDPTPPSAAVAAPRSGAPGAAFSAPPRAVAPSGPPPADAAEAWKRVLAELAGNTTSLAELLRARGRLVELGARHALVRCGNLRPEERVLLGEPRNKKACSAAFARVLGREIEVRFADAEPPPRAPKDPFTDKVTELFGGRIEDDA